MEYNLKQLIENTNIIFKKFKNRSGGITVSWWYDFTVYVDDWWEIDESLVIAQSMELGKPTETEPWEINRIHLLISLGGRWSLRLSTSPADLSSIEGQQLFQTTNWAFEKTNDFRVFEGAFLR